MRASQRCVQLNIKMPCWSAQRSVAADKEACRSTAAMHACTAQGASVRARAPSPTRLLTRKGGPAPHTLCCSALKCAASSSLQHDRMSHEVGFEGVNMRGRHFPRGCCNHGTPCLFGAGDERFGLLYQLVFYNLPSQHILCKL